MPSRDKRAISDESIRDMLPTEEPQVGTRNAENMTSLLNTDPAWYRTVLNPEVARALARISDDIHDTRRIDNTLNFQKKANDYLLSEEYKAKEREQILEQQTNQSFLDYKAYTTSHFYQLLEEYKRTPGMPLTFVLDKYLEETNKLRDANLKAGNVWLAGLIQKDAYDTYNSHYPSLSAATATKLEGETKFKLQANDSLIQNLIRYQNPSFGLEQGLMQLAKNHAQVDPLITTPDDFEAFRSSVGDAYKAQIDAIVNAGMQNNVSPDEVIASIESLIAFGLPNHVKDIQNIRNSEGRKGDIYLTGRYGTDIIVNRMANEAERLYFKEKGDDIEATAKKLGYLGAHEDQDGNLILQEIRDVSITDDAIKYAKQAITDFNKNRKTDFELSVIDKWNKVVDIDNLSQGKLENNDFIWSTDYFTYMDTVAPELQRACKEIIANPNSTHTQIQKAQQALEYDMSYVRPTLAIVKGMRFLMSNGKTAQEAQTYIKDNIIDKIEEKFQLNGGHRLSAEDLNDLVLQIGDVGISLAPPENMFREGYENIERLYYAEGLLKCFGEDSTLFKDPSKFALVSSSDTHKMAQETRNYISTIGRLVNVNDKGEYTTNKEGVTALSNLIDAAFTSSGNITNGLATKSYALEYILSPIYATYKNAKNKGEQEAYLMALSESPELVTAILSVNPSDPNAQKMKTMIGSYALTANSDTNKASLLKEYTANSATRYTMSNINSLVDNNAKTFKLKGYTGKAQDRIQQVINDVGVDPEYQELAKQLGVDLIAASQFAGNSEFDMEDFKTILNENFTNGQYNNGVNFNLDKYNGNTQLDMKEVNKELGDINKGLSKSAGHGRGVKAESATSSNLNIVNQDGTLQYLLDKSGNKTKATVYTNIALNSDKNSTMKVVKTLPELMSNLNAWSNIDDPSMYNGGFFNNTQEKTGIPNADLAKDATKYNIVMNQQGFQDWLKVYEKDNSKINPDILNQPTTKEHIYFATGGKTLDDVILKIDGANSQDVKAMSEDKKIKSAIKQLTPQEKSRLNYLKLADAYNSGKNLGYPNMSNNNQKISADPNSLKTLGAISYTINSENEKNYSLNKQITLGGFGGTLTSLFGKRTHPVTGQPDDHSGIDVAIVNVSAAEAGVVVAVVDPSKTGGAGRTVIIQDSNGTMFGYSHVSKNKLPKVGQIVQKGEVFTVTADPSVEKASNENSTGQHCHFMVKTGGQKLYSIDENGKVAVKGTSDENFGAWGKATKINPLSLQFNNSNPGTNLGKTANQSRLEVKTVIEKGPGKFISLGDEETKRKDMNVAMYLGAGKKYNNNLLKVLGANEKIFQNVTNESKAAVWYSAYLHVYEILKRTDGSVLTDNGIREKAWSLVFSGAKISFYDNGKPVKELQNLTGEQLLYKNYANTADIKKRSTKGSWKIENTGEYAIINKKIKSLRK